MRRFFSLRWLGLHVTMVAIVAGFLALGWWQMRRAQGGNPLSWGYTFEWPLFAGFVVLFWFKAMRDELRDARDDEPAGPAAQVTLPASIRSARTADGSADGAAGGAVAAGAMAGQDDQDDQELAAYNAYLSRLNAEASGTGGWLAGRGSRRQAAAWATRTGQPQGQAAQGKPPNLEV